MRLRPGVRVLRQAAVLECSWRRPQAHSGHTQRARLLPGNRAEAAWVALGLRRIAGRLSTQAARALQARPGGPHAFVQGCVCHVTHVLGQTAL